MIEFDQTWGHRNDVPGFHGGLLALDRALPRLLAGVRRGRPRYLYRRSRQRPDDAVHRSLARSRCRCWRRARGSGRCALGRRRTFADIGQTVAEFLGVPPLAAGTSFLPEVWSD